MADIIASAARRLAAILALALLTLGYEAAGARAATVVSLTFDDGLASQYDHALPQMRAHGMLGTFYVNSGNVDKPPYYMSWTQVDGLHAERHEIGGHTVGHKRLPDLTPSQIRSEICDDAANHRARGYQVLSFAYPHGAGSTNAHVQSALRDCGFVSARKYGELRGPDCTNASCPFAEVLPPANPHYAVKTPGYKASPYTLAELKEWVTEAEAHGGGWVPIVFHDIDDSGAESSVTPADFAAFVAWLKAQEASGTVVKTVRSVMGYPDPVPEQPEQPEQPAPVFAFGPPPDRATAFASLRVRSRQDVDKLVVRATMAEPGTLSASGAAGLKGKRYKFRRVAKRAVPGKLVKLRLKLTRKRLRIVKRALRRKKRVRAAITIQAKDNAGNVRTAKRTVRLRR